MYDTLIDGKRARKMMINTNAMVSLTEANQNFSRIARMADKNGSVVVLRNNKPEYALIKIDAIDATGEFLPDEDIRVIAKQIMVDYALAMEALAK